MSLKFQIKGYFLTNFGRFAGWRTAQRLRLAHMGRQIGVYNVAAAPLAVKMTAFRSQQQALT